VNNNIDYLTGPGEWQCIPAGCSHQSWTSTATHGSQASDRK